MAWPACAQEQDVLRNLVVPCMLDPLPGREVEVDEFQVCALPRLVLPFLTRRHKPVLPDLR